MSTTFATDCQRGPGCEWHPLEMLADVLSERGDDRVQPWAFMHMGVTQSRTGATVYLFKHCDTRRYLNLDTNGHAYRYVPETNTVDGASAYVLQDLDQAIEHALT